MSASNIEQLVGKLQKFATLSQSELEHLLSSIRRLALRTYTSLQTFIDAGGMTALLALIQQPLGVGLLATALHIIAFCCGKSVARKYFLIRGGMHVIINVVDVVADNGVCSHGVRALANLAKNSTLNCRLHEEDVIQLSVDKLRSLKTDDTTDTDNGCHRDAIVKTGICGAPCDNSDEMRASIIRLWRNMGQTVAQRRRIMRAECVTLATECLESSSLVLLKETLKMLQHYVRENTQETAVQVDQVPFALSRLLRLCGVTSCDDVLSDDVQPNSSFGYCIDSDQEIVNNLSAIRKMGNADDSKILKGNTCSGSGGVSCSDTGGVGSGGVSCSDTGGVDSGGVSFNQQLAASSLTLLAILARASSLRPSLACLGCLQLFFVSARLDQLIKTGTIISSAAKDTEAASVKVHHGVKNLSADGNPIDRVELAGALCLFACESVNRARLRNLGYLAVFVQLLDQNWRPVVTDSTTRWRWLQRRIIHALFQFVYDDAGCDQMRGAGLLPRLVQRLIDYTQRFGVNKRLAGRSNRSGDGHSDDDDDDCDADSTRKGNPTANHSDVYGFDRQKQRHKDQRCHGDCSSSSHRSTDARCSDICNQGQIGGASFTGGAKRRRISSISPPFFNSAGAVHLYCSPAVSPDRVSVSPPYQCAVSSAASQSDCSSGQCSPDYMLSSPIEPGAQSSESSVSRSPPDNQRFTNLELRGCEPVEFADRTVEFSPISSPVKCSSDTLCPSSSSAPSSSQLSSSQTSPVNTAQSGSRTFLRRSTEHELMLLLLSQESQRSHPDLFMSSERCITALLNYLTRVPHASDRAVRIIARISRNPHCFRQLVLIRLPSLISRAVATSEASTAATNDKSSLNWKSMIDALSEVASSSYGCGLLESMLRLSSSIVTSSAADLTSRSAIEFTTSPSNSSVLGAVSTATIDDTVPLLSDATTDTNSISVATEATNTHTSHSFTGNDSSSGITRVSNDWAVTGACLTAAHVVRLHTSLNKLMLHCGGLDVLMHVFSTEDMQWQVSEPTENNNDTISVGNMPACDAFMALMRHLPPILCEVRQKSPHVSTSTCQFTSCSAPHDVKLVLDDGVLPASRRKLAEGSDVMAALLTGQFIEADESSVRVRNLPLAVAAPLVHIIYGCSVLAVGSCDCISCKSTAGSCCLFRLTPDVWLQLLAACDRYLLLAAAEQLQQLIINTSCARQLRLVYMSSHNCSDIPLLVDSWPLPQFLLWKLLAAMPTGTSRAQLYMVLRQSALVLAQDLRALTLRLLTLRRL